MMRIGKLTALILVFLLPPAAFCWEGKAVEAVHGDELRVVRPDGRIENIRLYGVDSPIEPQPFGKEARLYLRKRVWGRMVDIQPLARDRFDRIIAWVNIDGESLNRHLLRQGTVWWYKKYVPWERELAALEEQARAERRGLWAFPSPVPPWEYQSLPPGERAGPSRETISDRRGNLRERILEKETASAPDPDRDPVTLRRMIQSPAQVSAEANADGTAVEIDERAIERRARELIGSPSPLVGNSGSVRRRLQEQQRRNRMKSSVDTVRSNRSDFQERLKGATERVPSDIGKSGADLAEPLGRKDSVNP